MKRYFLYGTENEFLGYFNSLEETFTFILKTEEEENEVGHYEVLDTKENKTLYYDDGEFIG